MSIEKYYTFLTWNVTNYLLTSSKYFQSHMQHYCTANMILNL